ncbi:hypothetical protein [Allomuricauda sp. d1]|uniref:hypothetical protein n=1 Tax=Allomuricauda sp. d1 TaxID=3136725 RepID=UPI0031DB8953
MQKIIQEYSETLIEVLQDVSKNNSLIQKSYVFDCEWLSSLNPEKVRETDEHKTYQELFRNLKGPVLYWFRIISDTSSSDIRQKLQEYKSLNSLDKKATPSLRNSFNPSSKILYVGKVKRNFWSRVIQHIGIYENKQTQGLQLMHWTGGLDLRVELNAIEFDEGMSNLISIFEWKLSKIKKPIIGIH